MAAEILLLIESLAGEQGWTCGLNAWAGLRLRELG